MFSDCDAVLLLHTEQDEGVALKYLTDYQGDFAYGVFFPGRKKPQVFVSSLESLPRSTTISYQHLTKRGQIKEVLLKAKVKTLGLCFSEVSKQTYDTLKKAFRGIKFVDVSKQLRAKREIKTKEEMRRTKEAVRLTEKLFEEAFALLPKVRYEKEVEQYLRKRMIELGVEPSFDPIVATGWHSKAPHYQASDRSLVLDGFCILDMGVKYKGYCSDMTRTVYIGTPSAAEKKIYKTILHELQVIEQHVHAGVREIETSFPMIHALGHGIGREVHEAPFLGHEELHKDMLIAIEPAQYWGKGGIRIEDNYVVQEKKLVRIGKSSRRLRIITR